jgi:hypothetical protein
MRIHVETMVDRGDGAAAQPDINLVGIKGCADERWWCAQEPPIHGWSIDIDPRCTLVYQKPE